MFAVNATGRISRKTDPNELAKEQQHTTGHHEILLLSLIESGWIQYGMPFFHCESSLVLAGCF